MNIKDAQKVYRTYAMDLSKEISTLSSKQVQAKKQYELTGQEVFGEQAATLQISMDATQKLYDDNQKVLDSLAEQYAFAWNEEVAKQQSDPECGIGAEMSRIMTTAQRIARGDEVPYTDEKKLMEYDAKLYQAVKSAQMLHRMEKHEKHESLWEGIEEAAAKYNPEEAAETATAHGLPEIPVEPIIKEEL